MTLNQTKAELQQTIESSEQSLQQMKALFEIDK